MVCAVLTDAKGVQYPVVEQSDFMVCQKKCDQYGPWPTTKPIFFDGHHSDFHNRFFIREGRKVLEKSVFALNFGYFVYLFPILAPEKLSNR